MEDRFGWLFDEAAIRWMQSLFGTSDPLPFQLLSLLGDTWGILLVLGLALWRYGPGPAGAVAAATMIAAPLWLGLASLFSVERPAGAGIVVFETLEAGGFPSGHVFHAMVAWGVLATRTRLSVWSAAVAGVATGVARIYLGVHFPTDVLASLLLAPLFVWAFARGWDRVRDVRIEIPTWAGVALLLMVLLGMTAAMIGPFDPGRARRWEIVGMGYGGALALALSLTWARPVAPLRSRGAILTGILGLAVLALASRTAAEAALWPGAVATGLALLWIVVGVPALFARGRRDAAVVRGARHVGGAILHDWRRTDAAARRAAGVVLGVGLFVALLLDWALIVLTRRLDRAGALEWEAHAITWLASRPEITFFDAMWVDAFGSSAMVVPALVAAVVWLAYRGRGVEAGLVAASLVGARAIMHTGWAIWSRARPELVMEGIAHPPGSLHAFPSGHVTQVVSVYGFLLYLALRRSGSLVERSLAWLAFAAFVAVVAAGRMRLGAHWPTDLVAGALLGATWVGFLVVATRLVAERPGARGDAGAGHTTSAGDGTNRGGGERAGVAAP